MKTIKKTLTAIVILLSVILIHFGLMNKIQKDLASIEYDFGLIF